MKKRNFYHAFLVLLATFFNACGVKKTNSYDRFGGGFSEKKQVAATSEKEAEKISDLVNERFEHKSESNLSNHVKLSEKQLHKINSIVNEIPEVKTVKKYTKKMAVLKRNIHAAVPNKEIPDVLKTAFILGGVGLNLIAFGFLFIAIFGFRFKNETVGGFIGVIMFLVGLILLLISLILAIIGGLIMLLTSK
jgi:hypothetical protein